MTEHPLFFNQAEAKAYASKLPDPTVRLLLQAAQGLAMGHLVHHHGGMKQRLTVKAPLDLLLFTQLLHSLFERKEYIDAILSGRYDSLDQIWDDLDMWFNGTG